MTDLLSWFAAPHDRCGVSFHTDDGSWRRHTYEELAALGSGRAGQLAASGVGPGDVVAILGSASEGFVAGLLGCWLLGAVPSPIAPPLAFGPAGAYVGHAAAALRVARPALVLAEPHDLPMAERIAVAAGSRAPVVSPPLRPGRVTAPAAPVDDGAPALLQFTSGSSGAPRAVRITAGNLRSNVGMIGRWLRMRADSVTASWLPVYHDMGLIGCLLTPMAHQSDVMIMLPQQFVRRPETWLRCFGELGATLTAAPSFGYDLAARRCERAGVATGDFSGVRACIVGAERVDPRALARFARALGPRGFPPAAFLPAYGLAEATLAVTGSPLDELPRLVRTGGAPPALGSAVDIAAEARLGDVDGGDPAGWMVGCGPALSGVAVAVVDGDGGPLPPDHIGEITVRGPTVATGYADDGERSTAITADALHTGDAGFWHDGELYVLGRLGDSVKVRGRNVYMEDLEARLHAVPSLPVGRYTVAGGPVVNGSGLLLIAETGSAPWARDAAATLEREAGGTAVTVMTAPPGTIPRTSSGKPRRRLLWERFTRGELDGRVVAAPDGG